MTPSLYSRIAKTALAAALCLPLAAHAGSIEKSAAPRSLPAELLVSCAVSMRESMTEIASLFSRSNPGATVVFNFGPSGELEQQINRGAAVDVFIAAAPENVRRLQDGGLIEKASTAELAQNQLVVVYPAKGSPVRNSTELLNCKRIALGNPATVPAGAYARSFLDHEQIYAKLKTQNRLVFAESARQILVYVETGNVDAGLVYNTDAVASKKVSVGFKLPLGSTGRISYLIAATQHSRHSKLAREFIQFCRQEHAQHILRKHGFKPPRQ